MQNAPSQPSSPASAESSDQMDTLQDDGGMKPQEVNMEELFATDDEDDEFNSSAQAKAENGRVPSSSPPPLPA